MTTTTRKVQERQLTIAEQYGYDLETVPPDLQAVVAQLHQRIESMRYTDTLMHGNFVLEIIVPDKGYTYFLLHHVIRNDGKDRCYVVQIRVKRFRHNPDNPADPLENTDYEAQFQKQLAATRRRLALFLALFGWKPEAVKLVRHGAFTDADTPMYRKRHLF